MVGMWFAAALTVGATDDGPAAVVEVAGLQIFATGTGRAASVDLMVRVIPAETGRPPAYQFDGAPHIILHDGGRDSAKPGTARYEYNGDAPQARPGGKWEGGDRWRITAVLTEAPPPTLAAIEGELIVTPWVWKTATFEGDSLKPNATVQVEGVPFKLIMFDRDRGKLTARLRYPVPPQVVQKRSAEVRSGNLGVSPTPVAIGTVVNASGNSMRLNATHPFIRLDHNDVAVNFTGEIRETPRKLTVELPESPGESQRVRFRLANIPIQKF